MYRPAVAARLVHGVLLQHFQPVMAILVCQIVARTLIVGIQSPQGLIAAA
jgi:hypothetical protein